MSDNYCSFIFICFGIWCYLLVERAWLSGITGPCQGPVGVSITPARTNFYSKNTVFVLLYKYCSRSSTDRVPVFGTVDVGSIPAGCTIRKNSLHREFFLMVHPNKAKLREQESNGPAVYGRSSVCRGSGAQKLFIWRDEEFRGRFLPVFSHLNFSPLCVKWRGSGYGLVVEHLLAKEETRFRLPLPAQQVFSRQY